METELQAISNRSCYEHQSSADSRPGFLYLAEKFSCTHWTVDWEGSRDDMGGCGEEHLLLAEVKKRVKLYFYSLSVPSWQVKIFPSCGRATVPMCESGTI